MPKLIKNGVFSDPTAWDTNTVPNANDDVYLNGFTVQVDTSISVKTLSNLSATTYAVAGGRCVIATNNLTLSAVSFFGGGGNNSMLLQVSGSNLNVNFVGAFETVGSGANGHVLMPTGSNNTINITGSLLHGIGTGACIALSPTSAGNPGTGNTINGTGDITAGSFSNSCGISVGVACQINWTGKVTGSAAPAILITSAAASLSHVGEAVAGLSAPAISVTSSGNSITVSGPFRVSPNNIHAIYSNSWQWASSLPISLYEVRTIAGSIRSLYTADSVGGNPVPSNVRSGIVYGPNNELTGTCAVPGAASVVSNVPVDNTVGTAAITASSIRNAIGLGSANLDAQLANKATVDQVAAIIQGAVSQ